MATYRAKDKAPTIESVTEPEQPAQPEQQVQRTPLGDAVFFGTGLLLWAAFVATLGHLLGLDRIWWTVGTAFVGLLAVAVARLAHGATVVTLWWAAALGGGFGWLAWARWANLRTPGPWLGLAGGALVVLSAYPLVIRHVAQRAAAAKRRAADADRKRAENYWPRLLTDLGFPGVTVVTRDETRGGAEVLLRLPATGKFTWKQLAQAADRLEVAAGMRHGSLRFEPGDNAREVILTVSTRDVLAETVPYVDDGRPLSIRNPIPIGLYEDGSICYVTLREACMLIIGLRRSGKSNLLNVLIAQLVRCVDALILLSDTKHRLAMPWVAPYLEDPGNKMAIHWVATDRDELEIMLTALLAGIKARSAAGSGGEKIEPTVDEPALITIIDEVASVFGENRGPGSGEGATTNLALRAVASEAVQLGGSEAAEFVLASQRGTVTMTGDGDMKSQFSTRIGLRVMSQADASYVIPDDNYAAQLLASLKHQGSGVVMESRDDRTAPVKFFRITAPQIDAVARRYGPMKPAPEALLQRVWGDAWAQRWDRFRATRQRVRQITDTDSEFRAMVATQLSDVEEATGDSATAARQKMRDFMARSGERGVTVKMICERLAAEDLRVTDRTVRRWLDKDIDAGIAERVNHLLVRMRNPGAAA